MYEEKVKCTHKFSEKCHDTFITDYVPTQERKCETSFDKNCRIRYRPMMFEEDVEICNEPLKKVCYYYYYCYYCYYDYYYYYSGLQQRHGGPGGDSVQHPLRDRL